jgi:hypothetical protein
MLKQILGCTFLILFSKLFIETDLVAQDIRLGSEELVFAAVKGNESRMHQLTIYNYTNQNVIIQSLELVGNFEYPGAFKAREIKGNQLKKGTSTSIDLKFTPPSQAIGLINYQLKIKTNFQTEPLLVNLYGISLKGIEGENEPALSTVLAALVYKIDPGWENLANHTKAEAQGEELMVSYFRKKAAGEVEMMPVARFSPDFKLPFGYHFPDEKKMPKLHQVGELAAAGEHHQHQTTYPELAGGATRFDPGDEIFGVFTYSPSHIAFSDDQLNSKFFPQQAEHATRIYPLRNRKDETIPGSYLICFEEAKNGDYQDYVFVLKNVEPVK